MISVITGLHGSGKTWYMVNKHLYPEWQRGGNVVALNTELLFGSEDRIIRAYTLSDLYQCSNALIGFPEIQKLLKADSWRSLPPMFADLLSEHRHSQLSIVGDTQDLMLIDVEMRRHIAEVYHCRTMLRFPKDEKKLPWLQWIRVQKKIRRFDVADDRPRFAPIGREKNYLISRLWTKKLYNTHESLAAERFLVWVDRPRSKIWRVHQIGRELLNSGRRKKR